MSRRGVLARQIQALHEAHIVVSAACKFIAVITAFSTTIPLQNIGDVAGTHYKAGEFLPCDLFCYFGLGRPILSDQDETLGAELRALPHRTLLKTWITYPAL